MAVRESGRRRVLSITATGVAWAASGLIDTATPHWTHFRSFPPLPASFARVLPIRQRHGTPPHLGRDTVEELLRALHHCLAHFGSIAGRARIENGATFTAKLARGNNHPPSRLTTCQSGGIHLQEPTQSCEYLSLWCNVLFLTRKSLQKPGDPEHESTKKRPEPATDRGGCK